MYPYAEHRHGRRGAFWFHPACQIPYGVAYAGNHLQEVKKIGLSLGLAELRSKRAVDRVAICKDSLFQPAQLFDAHMGG